MSALGVVVFVPSAPDVVPTPEQTAAILEALRPVASVSSREELQSGGERFELRSLDEAPAIARMTLPGGFEYVPFGISVVRHREPRDATEFDAQRYCGHCNALVIAGVTCPTCGVDEDPTTWTMGPDKVRSLFSGAFELKRVFSGGPDVWAKSDADVERACRQYFLGRLEAIESSLGTRLRMVRYVVA